MFIQNPPPLLPWTSTNDTLLKGTSLQTVAPHAGISLQTRAPPVGTSPTNAWEKSYVPTLAWEGGGARRI